MAGSSRAAVVGAGLRGGEAFDLLRPPVTLIFAAPSSTTPPQSPPLRAPTSFDEVKTIGWVAVPTALIFAALVITSDEPDSPLTVTPFSIVSVPPVTNTCVLST